jgi:hypothetical protein
VYQATTPWYLRILRLATFSTLCPTQYLTVDASNSSMTVTLLLLLCVQTTGTGSCGRMS